MFLYQTWTISWSELILKCQKYPRAPGIFAFPAICGVEKSLRGKKNPGSDFMTGKQKQKNPLKLEWEGGEWGEGGGEKLS